MSRLINALRRHACTTPGKIALQDSSCTLTYADLLTQVELKAEKLRALSPRVIGLCGENGCEWAVMDLAAWLADIPIIPLPTFFSAAQVSHVLKNAGIDLLIAEDFDRFADLFVQPIERCKFREESSFSEKLRYAYLTPLENKVLPSGAWKITFTSGSTGDPKGVCLDKEQLEVVAEQLKNASGATCDDRHLCVLPLSTLLENIGGLYAPLLAGATIYLPASSELGFSGSSGLRPDRLLNALCRWSPTTTILVPQLLRALIALGSAGAHMPTTWRYIAVGGAPLAANLLHEARTLGLPVYEGYGLSECASVVAMNTLQNNRIGSVGKPLPHIHISCADDGEIRVHGMRWNGYLGEPTSETGDFIATGDIGYMDAAGFLFITGRKKNIFINAFGRNISPEWVERELLGQAVILQACVFGEARPLNYAVIFANKNTSTQAIEAAISSANLQLPDYARVHAWIRAGEPFSVANGFVTENGRVRRDRIFDAYAEQIDEHFKTNMMRVGGL